jgi:hypothetical protein
LPRRAATAAGDGRSRPGRNVLGIRNLLPHREGRRVKLASEG